MKQLKLDKNQFIYLTASIIGPRASAKPFDPSSNADF